MARSSVRILHLSDIHFGRDHRFDPKNAGGVPKASLTNLLDSIVSDADVLNAKPDIVVVSGDLTSTARKEEFGMAGDFLRGIRKRFELQAEDFIIVPGNHDVSWGKKGDEASHAEYITFASEFYNEPVQRVAIRSVRIGDVYLVGLDSTTLETEDNRGIGLIGNDQIEKAARRLDEEARDARAKFLVIHHHLLPVAWVEPVPVDGPSSRMLDSKAIIQWVQERQFAAILHGHQHQPFVATVHLADRDGGPVLVMGAPSAGSISLPPQGRNGYAWIEVDDRQLRLTERLMNEDQKYESGKRTTFVLEPSGVFAASAIPSARRSRIVSADEMRTLTRSAASRVAETARQCYGPHGGLRGVQVLGGVGHVRDGERVIRSVEIADPIEGRVIDSLRAMSRQVGERAGDGRKLAELLAAAMIDSALAKVMEGAADDAVAEGIAKATAAAVAALRSESKGVSTIPNGLVRVATSATLGMEDLGVKVSEAVVEAGECGVIDIERGSGTDTVRFTVSIGPPFSFAIGSVPTYLVEKFGIPPLSFKNPLFVVYEGKLATMPDMLPILEQARQRSRPLVILCQGMEGEALATIMTNCERDVLTSFPIEYPLGWQTALLQDMGIVTGARVVRPEAGESLRSWSEDSYGEAECITLTRDTVIIAGGRASGSRLQQHREFLKSALVSALAPGHREHLRQRLCSVAARNVRISIEGCSDQQWALLEGVVQDGVRACQSALESGVVCGGGAGLARVAERVERDLVLAGDASQGKSAVVSALRSPLEILVETSTEAEDGIVQAVISSPTSVFDGRTAAVVAWMEAGPMDATGVVCTALSLAGDAAARIIRTRSWELGELSESKLDGEDHPGISREE